MKIRNGFVSNSSSSSFVVVFPQIPISDIDVMQMMFGNPPKIRGVQGWGDERSSIYDVAGRVFDDISSQKENDMDKIYGEMRYFDHKYDGGTEKGLFDEFDSPENWNEQDAEIKKQSLDWKKEEDRSKINAIEAKFRQKGDRIACKMMKKFMDKYKTGFVFVFEYGDHNGDLEANCEQGDIFRYLPHIKISKH